MKSPRVFIFGVLALSLASIAQADDGNDRWGPVTSGPFYTGTAEVEPLGSDFIEPWWYDQRRPNQNTTTQYMPQRMTIGLAEGWEFSMFVPMAVNQISGAPATGVGDTTLWFKHSLVEDADTLHFWARPAVSLEGLFVLPTGQYSNLNSSLKGADQTGGGTFDESLQLILRKRFKPFSLYAQVGDYVSNPNNVQTGFGFNNAIMAASRPLRLVNGNLIDYDLALEQVFNDHWGFGCVLEISGQSQSNSSLFNGQANAPAWSYLWGDAGLEMTWPNTDEYAVTWGAGMTWPLNQVNYPKTYSPMATVTFNFMGHEGYRGQND